MDKNKEAYDFIEKVFKQEKKAPFLANWDWAFDYAEKEKIIVLSDKQTASIYEEMEKNEEREKIKGMQTGGISRYAFRKVLDPKVKRIGFCKLVMIKHFTNEL